MNITILGAGAMGCLFGAYLSRGNQVTLVSHRPQTAEAIGRAGLEIREPDGSAGHYRVKAVADTAGMDTADLVILFIKSTASEAALSGNRGIIGPDTYLMTLQNGSGHEDILSRFAPPENIIIGTTQHNASTAAPGVSVHGGAGLTHLGCVTGHAGRLQPIADVFTACGLETDVRDDVQKMIWNKMFTNVSASALTGVLQVPLGYISRDGHAWQLCRALIREAVEVAAGLGMEFDYEQKVAEVKAVCDNAPNGLTSIYADLRHGRPSEVDAISGSIVRAGARAGIPTPRHQMMVELIHAMEKRGEP